MHIWGAELAPPGSYQPAKMDTFDGRVEQHGPSSWPLFSAKDCILYLQEFVGISRA